MIEKQPLKPLSALADTLVVSGIYQHYSGKQYRVLGVARHSETLEEYVMYQALYGEGNRWIRPVSMFCELVTMNGTIIPRFALIAQK